MKFNGWEKPKPIPDMLISKNEVLMLIANYQMGTDPHSEIGNAQYDILEMLFRSVQSLKADRKTEPQTCDTCRFEDRYGDESICKECSRHYSDCYIPKNEPLTTDYCDTCDRKECEYCFADGSNPYCMPSNYHKVKDESTISKMEQVDEPSGYCNECKWYGDKQVCGRCRSRNLYAPKTEPQTMYYPQVDGITPSVIVKTENGLEKPNNCEHITEDGVTCAKYPACDDCPDNPLIKVKGSERLVKGLGKLADCRTCKWWSIYGYCVHRECKGYEPQTETKTETQNSNLTFEKADERCKGCGHYKLTCDLFSEICKYEPKDEPQKWETPPKFEHKGIITTCVGVPMALIEDEPMKTTDYCDICKRDMCEVCIADATNPYCVPSHYEINYEPKDEPQTDCAWK